MNRYYDEVIAGIREAERVLIMGPGEAKGELRKRLEHATPDVPIVAVEAAGKMTDQQIAPGVREYVRGQDSTPESR